MKLRGYQEKGVSSILSSLARGGHPLAVVATGGGKTIMIASLVKILLINCSRVLIIAHTGEIVEQIGSACRKNTDCETGIVAGDVRQTSSDVLVATRQSLNRGTLDGILRYGGIGAVVIDEAHHATMSNSYGKIIGYINKCSGGVKLVGFTATPRKSVDGLFTSIVFSWSVEEGTESGVLVPIKEMIFRVPPGCGPNENDDFVLDIFRELIVKRGRRALVFFGAVEKSKQFAAKALFQNIAVGHIDGGMGKRERDLVLSEYKKGGLIAVCNVGVLTEGFDAPFTDAIMMVRRTRSQTLSKQIIGRGVRRFPGKRDCLLIRLN